MNRLHLATRHLETAAAIAKFVAVLVKRTPEERRYILVQVAKQVGVTKKA